MSMMIYPPPPIRSLSESDECVGLERCVQVVKIRCALGASIADNVKVLYVQGGITMCAICDSGVCNV